MKDWPATLVSMDSRRHLTLTPWPFGFMGLLVGAGGVGTQFTGPSLELSLLTRLWFSVDKLFLPSEFGQPALTPHSTLLSPNVIA